jgi:hypothetical protein
MYVCVSIDDTLIHRRKTKKKKGSIPQTDRVSCLCHFIQQSTRRTLVLVQVADGDGRRPLPRVVHRHGATDPRVGARDDGDLALELAGAL